MAAGIAFDVDGVLYLGSAANPVPGAIEIVQRLWKGAEIAVPHVFITNGTGYTEAGKVAGGEGRGREGKGGEGRGGEGRREQGAGEGRGETRKRAHGSPRFRSMSP